MFYNPEFTPVLQFSTNLATPPSFHYLGTIVSISFAGILLTEPLPEPVHRTTMAKIASGRHRRGIARNSVDTVRASRDGHEYHEAWAARISLQLLWPESHLSTIAVEGLSVEDNRGISAQTVQIVDLVLYYGGGSTFERSSRTSLVQLKYSVADEETEFRSSHAKKTIPKFAQAYIEFRKKYGVGAVREKLHFQIITNRPIFKPLLEAMHGLANGRPLKAVARRQADQLSAAAGLSSPLKKALLTGFHSTAKHNATKAVSPSSETMRTI